MTMKTNLQCVSAIEVSEGAGVTVYRSIGLPGLKNLDPFIMLDYFGSQDPSDYIAGFPSHPHRGFITLTYMLEGHMLHEDSMGNKGDLVTGGAQWMKAASGVIHSEMPQQTQGTMKGFQLWINLPAIEKMSQPEYQEYSPDAIPQFNEDGINVRVLSGQYKNVSGPIVDELTELQYFDIRMDEGASFACPVIHERTGFIYIYDGKVNIGELSWKKNNLIVLNEEGEFVVHAANSAARLLFLSGRPIGEPIVQRGPFVMNSNEEIHKAIQEYQNGTFVKG